MKNITQEKIQQIANPFLNATEDTTGFTGSKKALKDLRDARRTLKMLENNIDDYVKELQQKTNLGVADILPRLIRSLPELIRENKEKEQRARKNIEINAQLIKMNINQL